MLRRVLAATAAVALLAACSSSDGDGGDAAERPAPTTEPAPRCTQGATVDDVDAEPVPGVESDLTVTSFDGTPIRAHWFPAPGDDPVPTVLMGPGWSLPGDTSRDGAVLFGAAGIGPLNDAGYNVLTWDPRGFGASGGTATVNAPDAEGRDVQVLLDWVAEQPEALLDGNGDPRAGMVGFSYGGGIQLTVASRDCRVDAIVPGLAWHSLGTSLFKADTPKTGWAGVLVDAAAAGSLDPHILSASEAAPTGVVDPADVHWFLERGPGGSVGGIEVPTLLVQGTVDTLFTLDEAVRVHEALVARDVPVSMLWFCGGHGTCLTSDGDADRVGDATFAWLDAHLRGDDDAPPVPAFATVDQEGTWWTADAYPEPTATIAGTRFEPATLALTAEGGSGGITPPAGTTDPLAGLVAGITPAPATNAVTVAIDPTTSPVGSFALGAPVLRFTYAGTVPPGERPTRVFAQIVDPGSGTVVGNQVTPIPVTLDGAEHEAEADLEIVAHRLVEGARLELQLVATTTAYATPRLGGEITFRSIEIGLPVVEGLTGG